MIQQITFFIANYGLFAIFILMTLESALIPIPSEITMPFAGFLAGRGVFLIPEVIFVGALGNLFGSIIAYSLGYFKGESWVKVFIRKWGKWFLIHEDDFEKAKTWFQKYGQVVSFTSRLMPILRTFISLPAGIARMNVLTFSFFTFLGSLIWSGILAYMGLKLGQNWLSLEPYFRKFQFVILGIFVLLVILYVRSHLRRKRG